MSKDRIVVGVSGPTGIGKDYLQIYARERLGLHSVTQHTTRPARPAGAENKIPVPVKEYMKLYKEGLLVGHHIEESATQGKLYYGYLFSSIEKAVPTTLELNPVTATHIIDELEERGIQFAGWIGLIGDEDYLISNIKNRESMAPREIEKRMELSRAFMEVIEARANQGIITHVFKAGWHNRSTMGDEFTEIVRDVLKI